jgi:hypothetical protein
MQKGVLMMSTDATARQPALLQKTPTPVHLGSCCRSCRGSLTEALLDLGVYPPRISPEKQGCFLPGTRIPVSPVERIRETRPDYLVILPWNPREEIMSQMSWIRDWGGRFCRAHSRSASVAVTFTETPLGGARPVRRGVEFHVDVGGLESQCGF